jgi:hypothetical protein
MQRVNKQTTDDGFVLSVSGDESGVANDATRGALRRSSDEAIRTGEREDALDDKVEDQAAEPLIVRLVGGIRIIHRGGEYSLPAWRCLFVELRIARVRTGRG